MLKPLSFVPLFLLTSLPLLQACGGGGGGVEVSSNNAPQAQAGVNQQVIVGSNVALNASASSDADGDSLSYAWSFVSYPNGSSASISNSDMAEASFVADLAGSYQLSLNVSDGQLSSSDIVTITAGPASSVVDITDALLVSRSTDCADYQGSYQSQVNDLQRSQEFSGELEIASSGDNCQFSSNEIPNHDFNDASARFATAVSEQVGNYQISASPLFAASTTELNLGVTNAVFLNGVTLDLLAAACYGVGSEPLGEEKIGCGSDQLANPWRYDPMSPLNSFGTDSHNAHSQPDGTYHYHGNPMALFEQGCELLGEASPVIGFAADGFPIMGSCFTDSSTGNVRKAQSSYQLKTGTRQPQVGYSTPVAGVGVVASASYDGQFRGDWHFQAGSGDLDECNGMEVDGQYAYYVTDAYPWVLGCFKGEVDSSFTRTGRALDNNLHSH